MLAIQVNQYPTNQNTNQSPISTLEIRVLKNKIHFGDPRETQTCTFSLLYNLKAQIQFLHLPPKAISKIPKSLSYKFLFEKKNLQL